MTACSYQIERLSVAVWACRYRSSHDINNKPESWFGNLQLTLFALGDPPLSRPGCWACAPRATASVSLLSATL